MLICPFVHSYSEPWKARASSSPADAAAWLLVAAADAIPAAREWEKSGLTFSAALDVTPGSSAP
jgi:hypothetical protein